MSTPAPAPVLADLIFSEQANHNFSKILGDLKRSNLSITNRLNSIRHDASFVEEVAEILRLPVVANERCGSWYINPELKAGSAYFKSTDGHTGQWKFSTRRLNFQLLDLIGLHNGCIIVDSTRRGKRMPDALSKTVPVWCCVLNRALFPDQTSAHTLYVPPNVVSDSERSQMEARVPEFLASLLALDIDTPSLRQKLKDRPLRPLWVTQDQDNSPEPEIIQSITAQGFHPVVCCTSSRRVVGTEMSEEGYIQGAGDDTENWALGLTAPLFWAHADELLGAAEADLPDLIARLLEADAEARRTVPSDVRPVVAPWLFIGTLSAKETALASGGGKSCCVVSLVPQATEKDTWVKAPNHIEVGVGKSSKSASRMLREALPQICDFVSQFLEERQADGREKGVSKIVILCESGRDLSVGVALALYCWCFDASGTPIVLSGPEGNDGNNSSSVRRGPFNKNGIRVKLSHIVTAAPDANPSRATLQSVNSFLMDWRN